MVDNILRTQLSRGNQSNYVSERLKNNSFERLRGLTKVALQAENPFFCRIDSFYGLNKWREHTKHALI